MDYVLVVGLGDPDPDIVIMILCLFSSFGAKATDIFIDLFSFSFFLAYTLGLLPAWAESGLRTSP